MKQFLDAVVHLDKIIVVVCWIEAKRLVENELSDSYYIFLEEKDI